ncbi:MAG: hypothetical protein HUJ25_04605 [Crocinitomicaceae bacterium]|nr:hypothetical protein [Crocinitomicaceae bacterium]
MKFLYLDDESGPHTTEIAELLEAENNCLEIKVDYPKSFGDQIKQLKKEKYDGLIFDLRLDEKSKAEYRALTLAQEVRTRATEGTMDDIPIIVCSTDSKLKRSYNKDSTGHDLFDAKYLKNEELVENSERVSIELVSFAKGYNSISELRSKIRGAGAQLKQFLGLDEKGLQNLDLRLIDYFGEIEGRLPVHEYARFIMNELILTTGPLVDSEVLAARLGVDTKSADFDKLLNKLKFAKYKGPFNDGWNRWWWHLIEDWWGTKTETSLAFMDAKERVEELIKIVKLSDLTIAKPILKSYGTSYWYTCELYNKPLDPIDGVLIETKEPLAWQDQKYISIKAALDIKSKAAGIFPHQLEKERVKELIKESKGE